MPRINSKRRVNSFVFVIPQEIIALTTRSISIYWASRQEPKAVCLSLVFFFLR